MLAWMKPTAMLWSYSGKVANTATRLRCCSTSQDAASQNGSSHGSTSEATTISIADRPLWLYQPTATAAAVISVSPSSFSTG